MKIFRTAVVALMLALLPAMAHAQDTTSPYSKFGYGLLRDNATSAQSAMGGVGYAMNSGRQINVMNPASYAMIDTLTFLFDTGVSLTQVWSADKGVRDRGTGGGLDYLTMQFPLGRYMGGCVGLVPYSSVGYSFGSKIANGTQLRDGDGGLSQLFLGLSGRLPWGFAVGANVGYLFGNTYNSSYATSDIGTTSLFSQEMQVRDFHIELGLQYTARLPRGHSLTFGMVFAPAKTLLGHTMVTTSEVVASANGSNVNVLDTVADVSLKNRFSLPATWGFGVAYRFDKHLLVEADLTFQPWSKAKFPKLDNFISTTFQDRYRVALGAQYVRNQRGPYLQRINYRAGLFFNRDYITVASNSVKEWGASVGFGLPAPAGKTIINLGVEYRNRRAYPNPLLKEQYLTITLGVNFNEVWFWKNKIR